MMIFISILLAGCLPKSEVDVYEILIESDFIVAEAVVRTFVSEMKDDSIFPKKPRNGCSIKDHNKGQLFLCIEGKKLILGEALHPGNTASSRAEFQNFLEQIKIKLDLVHASYNINYKQNIDRKEFRTLDIYD